MSIKDEIFKRFLEKLKNDKDFPEFLYKGLENLIKSNEFGSQEKIIDIIKKGERDGS